MTLQELNQHYILRQRLAKAEEMLNSMISAASLGAQVLTGMPHGSGVRDKVGDLAIEIAELDSSADFLRKKIQAQEKAILPFINSIENFQTRMIFRLRFIRGMTWGEVAAVIGGGNTEEAVKSSCYRFLRSCNGETPHDA